MTHPITVAALAALVWTAGCRAVEAAPESAPPAAPPNVVLILSDDQAWTDYGFMGHEHIRTPHLDRLADEGELFRRGYVTTSLCRPSLATIVTGLYPHEHRLTSNDPPKGQPREVLTRHIDGAETLPRMLAERGYVSFQSGKWWEGSYERGGFTQGMTRGQRHGDDGLTIGREGLGPVAEFIDGATAAEQPFFVWYAPFMPHRPHNPPARLLEHYEGVAPSPQHARYWAMCEWFDETCGELLALLDERGLAENTLVLYVCDNGWIQLAGRDGYDKRSKRSAYDGGLRTPIIVRWPAAPGGAPTGESTALASSLDLAPTILAATGASASRELPGVDLLAPRAVAERETIFGEIFEHDAVDPDVPASSLRYRWCIDGRWKLIVPRAEGESTELFDLVADPAELNDLAEQYPERVRELAARIDDWWPAD